jgi:hypothetical protein
MPATSIAQQNFFKLVNAYKKGGLKKSEVSKDVVAAAKEMNKKQISDFLKVKKNAPDVAPSNMRMDLSIVNDPNIDPSMYEDITLEDLYKFEKLMELYDTQYNSRTNKYIKL